MEPTWATRELPVLDAIVRHFEDAIDDPHLPEAKLFAERTGLPVDQVARAVAVLTPTYARASPTMGGWQECVIMGVTDAARRAVGQWPSPEPIADRIVRDLLAAAEREPDAARRSKLRAGAEALGGFARDVLVDMIANVATKPIGL